MPFTEIMKMAASKKVNRTQANDNLPIRPKTLRDRYQCMSSNDTLIRAAVHDFIAALSHCHSRHHLRQAL